MLDLTEKEFEKIVEIMYKATGVFLRSTKKNLIINRLRTRLADLKLNSFSAYIALLEKNSTDEINIFINQITTNETYFFRHALQFNFLHDVILPDLKEKYTHQSIRIWSAACSSGEEPYSIAILCKEFLKNNINISNDYIPNIEIIGSDINSEVIVEAMEAHYGEKSLRETPESIIAKYFIEKKIPIHKSSKPQNTASSINSINPISIRYYLNSEIKKSVKFIAHNLLNEFAQKSFDVIFLRNVLIYFDSYSKKRVLSNLYAKINNGGYLILGLSEGLNDTDLKFKFIHSGIYKKE
ncbi:MAG: protein-glutamate O-methyltransferase CheR [Oligoflexia bacterium]|nr:protein-glutamate O-methyltransferase CheR [Oligoflexia bacterium]